MPPPAWITLAVVVGMFALMVRETAPAVAIVGALVVLLALGIIDERAAFAGFANPAPITVAALFVVARAVERTGGLQPFLRAVVGNGHRRTRDLLRLLVPSAAASAFLNNTPIVAMLLPGVVRSAEEHQLPPSRYLMPLSFAVVLGGVATTIGTSTNLVVSGMLEAAGQPPLGLFEITPLALPIALAGIALLALAAPRLLPDRESPRLRFAASEREFVVRMIVDPSGPLVGRTVNDANLRHLERVFLAQIERDGEALGPAGPDAVLSGGDHLLFVGEARNVADLRGISGLRSAEDDHLTGLDAGTQRLVEVVIGAQSSLIGRTPREANFRAHYQAAIVGIQREGEPVGAKLGTVRLRLGDTLLLLTDSGFAEHWDNRSDFLIVSAGGAATAATDPLRAALVGAVTLAIVVAAGSGALPILQASLLGAFAVLVLGGLSVHEARSAIEVDVLIVIAASFGVGAAIESSGLAAVISHGLVGFASDFGWRASLAAVVVATVVLTEFISNNAAAALMFPIAMATAAEVGTEPRRFAIAVAIAASCSFLTPIGYQTNTMVYGPGGYRFGDYWRLGAPLTLLVAGWVIAAA